MDIAEDEILTLEFIDVNVKSIQANYRATNEINIKNRKTLIMPIKMFSLNEPEILYIRVHMMR